MDGCAVLDWQQAPEAGVQGVIMTANTVQDH